MPESSRGPSLPERLSPYICILLSRHGCCWLGELVVGGPGFLISREPSLTPHLLWTSLSSSVLPSAAPIFTLPVQLRKGSPYTL